MKNFIYFLCALFLVNLPAFAIQIENTSHHIISDNVVKIQINKVRTRRMIIANALLLNDYQKQKADNIYNKFTENEALIYSQLKNEKEIYQKMKNENVAFCIKSQQKKLIAKLQYQLDSIQKQEDAEFKKILDRKQKTKYKRLKKEIELSVL